MSLSWGSVRVRILYWVDSAARTMNSWTSSEFRFTELRESLIAACKSASMTHGGRTRTTTKRTCRQPSSLFHNNFCYTCFAFVSRTGIGPHYPRRHSRRSECCVQRVCLSVCLFVRAVTGKRLELSTPNLVHVYSIAVAQHALTLRSKGHSWRSHGYENRHGC